MTDNEGQSPKPIAANEPLRVAIIALPMVGASSVYIAYDDFMAVGRLDRDFSGTIDKDQGYFFPEIVSLENKPVPSASGIMIHPHKTIDEMEHCDIVYIPASLFSACMGEDGGKPIYQESLLQWIRDRYNDGAMIVSLCSGSYLLAATGLIDGLAATCHWVSADHFQQCHPQIDVQSKKPMIVTGDAGRLVMTGTGIYNANLIIYLIQRLIGVEEAHEFAKISGKFWMDDKQDAYARLNVQFNHSDRAIRGAQHWLSENLAEDRPVHKMALQTFQTDRTFARRFKAATGFSPQSYVQAVRIERARHLLEASRKPVQEIAQNIGYDDVSSFRRLFVREVGMPPSDYRRRFKLPPTDAGIIH